MDNANYRESTTFEMSPDMQTELAAVASDAILRLSNEEPYLSTLASLSKRYTGFPSLANATLADIAKGFGLYDNSKFSISLEPSLTGFQAPSSYVGGLKLTGLERGSFYQGSWIDGLIDNPPLAAVRSSILGDKLQAFSYLSGIAGDDMLSPGLSNYVKEFAPSFKLFEIAQGADVTGSLFPSLAESLKLWSSSALGLNGGVLKSAAEAYSSTLTIGLNSQHRESLEEAFRGIALRLEAECSELETFDDQNARIRDRLKEFARGCLEIAQIVNSEPRVKAFYISVAFIVFYYAADENVGDAALNIVGGYLFAKGTQPDSKLRSR